MSEHVLALDFSVGELPCHLLRVNPDSPSKPDTNYFLHRHPTIELHYVMGGRCSIAMDKTLFPVEAGQLFLIPPGFYHYVSDVSTDLSRMTISIQLDPPPSRSRENLASRIFAALSPSAPLLLDISPDSTLERILSQMRVLSLASGSIAQEKLRASSQLLVLELFDTLTCAETSNLPASTVPPAPQDFVIDEFFGRSFHLNNGGPLLAQQLNVSTRQLYRIIKQSYGMNYRDKLKEIRLEIALDFLSHTDKSIAQISQLLGYGTSANFSAFIKRSTGKTPSQLRKESRSHL